MEKILTGGVLGGRLFCRIFASHDAPTINVNEVSCVVKRAGELVEILINFIFKYAMTKFKFCNFHSATR